MSRICLQALTVAICLWPCVNSAKCSGKCLSLQGGGIIDGAFLQFGLIDELSLVVYPGIDGWALSPSVFEYMGADTMPARGQSLELLSAETLNDGVVWLRYKFHK